MTTLFHLAKFSNKQIDLQKNIIIVEDDKIISSSDKVAEKLNNFFIEAVENLEIESYAPNTDNNIHKIWMKLQRNMRCILVF